MVTSRTDLEALTRDELLARAERLGLQNAAVLTRPELMDEILLRESPDRGDPTLRVVRGFFGIARDLLARVVERGLHLPETAALLRSIPVAARLPEEPQYRAVPTVTLAEVYATQGHLDKAIETLDEVLAKEPEHHAAQTMREQFVRTLSGEGATKIEGPECFAFPTADGFFVYWNIADRELDGLVLRVLSIRASWPLSSPAVTDLPLGTRSGERVLPNADERTVQRVCIGRTNAGKFEPIAHSPLFQMAESAEASLDKMKTPAYVRWTVRGPFAVLRNDPDYPGFARALSRLEKLTSSSPA